MCKSVENQKTEFSQIEYNSSKEKYNIKKYKYITYQGVKID